jgi:hypothetical protein
MIWKYYHFYKKNTKFTRNEDTLKKSYEKFIHMKKINGKKTYSPFLK